MAMDIAHRRYVTRTIAFMVPYVAINIAAIGGAFDDRSAPGSWLLGLAVAAPVVGQLWATLALMNEGARLDDIVHAVKAPAHLLEKPYLRPVYDEPEFVVRNLWRQFGAPDPDVDYVWWHSETADGDVNFLNFARLYDEQVDDALQRGREQTDPTAREEAYADFQRRLTELIQYVWLNHSVWTVAADNDIRDITNGPLPDGEESLPIGGTGTFGGTHRLTQVWLER